MKKLVFLVLITLAGCEVENITMIPAEKHAWGMDFSPYSHKGFLFTSESYNGKYESVGLVNYSFRPKVEYKQNGFTLDPYEEMFNRKVEIPNYQWIADSASVSDAINEIYGICLKLGADALINFQYTVTPELHDNIKHPVKINVFRFSGFAIKRKDQ